MKKKVDFAKPCYYFQPVVCVEWTDGFKTISKGNVKVQDTRPADNPFLEITI